MTETEVFICPSCQQVFPKNAGTFDNKLGYCTYCAASGARSSPAVAPAPPSPAVAPAPPLYSASKAASAGSAALLTALLTSLGLAFMLVGLNFLFNPGVPVDGAYRGIGSVLPDNVVNLQRLTMGETFTIVGAIFLAAAWRPH